MPLLRKVIDKALVFFNFTAHCISIYLLAILLNLLDRDCVKLFDNHWCLAKL